MFEYTEAYLNPFSWAKRAYTYMLSQVNSKISITQDELLTPSLSFVDPSEIVINTDSDWNKHSIEQMNVLAGMYKGIDQADSYYNSLYTLLNSRLSESETRLREQESALRVLLSSNRFVASTSINIMGGDLSSVEKDEKYYRTFGPLESVPIEGIFRLKDTGSFSSIRSLGGFGGKIEIDFSLGSLITTGPLEAIADGYRNTFWSGAFLSPAPLKADQNSIPWLSDDYKHGYACMLTYYMDRPTLATEVFIDPVVTEPLDLVSISWSPIDLSTSIVNGDFSASGGWNFVGTSTYLPSSFGAGIASGACSRVSASSSWVSQTFSLSGSYLATGATALVSFGKRCQITYSMKGNGDLISGVRIAWLDSSGKVIDYRLREDFPAGFYTSYRLVDFIPSNAVSGRIDLGIFSSSTNGGSAFFDDVKVYLGEKEFRVQETITKSKTISLPEIVRSDRISFVFSQRNPRREILAKETTNINIPNLEGDLDIDSSLIKSTKSISDSFSNPGPGLSSFVYRIGLKELDLRYREHIPRGSLVSLPLITPREIRQIWSTAEIGQYFNDNTKFYIYPFATNTEEKLEILPFRVGEVDSASTYLLNEGEILKIHTKEEIDAGWVDNLDKTFVVEPKTITENFDGSDRDGKIKLSYAPHLRRVKLRNVQEWLKNYSIWATPFDPNLEILYGLPSSMRETINAIRNNSTSGYLLDDLISSEGYIPIKVTVSTDKWNATPDVYGRPDISKVRSVLLEQLTETTLVETLVDVKEDYLSYDSWMTSTNVGSFIQQKWGSQWNHSIRRSNNIFNSLNLNDKDLESMTLKAAYDLLIKNKPYSKGVYDNFFKSSYDLFKAANKIPKTSNSSRTTTAAIEVDDVYTTKYKPIITGPAGAFIQLYWYNPTTVNYLPMSRSAYEVINSEVGLIKILESPPSSGFTSILADYKYISYTQVEDHFGSIIGFAIPSSGASGAAASNIGISSKPFPITRNMTDYENGKIPSLRSPNFDRLSKDYYPIIEYYINADGEIIFSRDFFRYGDVPARITIEYQTLAIQPRIGLEITRSGSPAATPTILNVSLRVKESAPLPLREAI